MYIVTNNATVCDYLSPAGPTTAGLVVGGSLSRAVPKSSQSPQLKGQPLESWEEQSEGQEQCSGSQEEGESEGDEMFIYKHNALRITYVHLLLACTYIMYVVPLQLNNRTSHWVHTFSRFPHHSSFASCPHVVASVYICTYWSNVTSRSTYSCALSSTC